MFEIALENNAVTMRTRKMIVMDKDEFGPTSENPFEEMFIPLPVSGMTPKERCDNFIKDLADKLGTELPNPEDEIVRQDDLPVGPVQQAMFFVSKGSCIVSVRVDS